MATTVVLHPDPQKFAAGATVKAYKRSNWANQTVAPSGTPEGSQDASATVAADGSVSFSSLTDETAYVIYAASPDRYAFFSTKTALDDSQNVAIVGTVTTTATDVPATAPTTQTSAAQSTTTADVLAANSAATYRQIQNVDATNGVTLKLGSGAATDYQGVYLPPNSVWDGWIGRRFYTGLIRGKSVAGTPTLSVIEG